MKKLVILGFDGTFVDTSPGIMYCFNTTAAAMGYAPVDHETLCTAIGIPLDVGFKKLFNMSDDEIEYASNNYSKLYSQKGKEMFTMYDGMEKTLEDLKNKGCKLAIATQKHSMYTKDMLEASDTAKFFDAVCATDVDTNLEKSDLLLQACKKTDIEVSDAVLIGDSEVDALGAEKIGMDFAAALYGCGFKSREAAEKFDCKAYIKSASEICFELLGI